MWWWRSCRKLSPLNYHGLCLSKLYLDVLNHVQFGCVGGWLVAWLICCLLGLLVGCLLDWLVDWIVVWLIAWLVNRMVGWPSCLVRRQVGWLLGWWVALFSWLDASLLPSPWTSLLSPPPFWSFFTTYRHRRYRLHPNNRPRVVPRP